MSLINKQVDIIDDGIGYINLGDLGEVVRAYFQGQLNHVPDKWLYRIHMEPEYLIPGNTLLSVLDEYTFRRVLYLIPDKYYFVVHYVNDPEDAIAAEEVKHYYYHAQTDESFDDFVNNRYGEALMAICEVLFQKIL